MGKIVDVEAKVVGEESPPVVIPVGCSVIYDIALIGLDPSSYDNPDFAGKLCKSMSMAAGVTVAQFAIEKFQPQGIAISVIFKERAQISYVTWPEVRFATLDFTTVGSLDESFVKGIGQVLQKLFMARSVKYKIATRKALGE